MVLGLTSIPNLYSIILRSMDVCHRADSKPYACGKWDSHTPITTKVTPASSGLWFGAGLSQRPSSPRSRSRMSQSRTVERDSVIWLAIWLAFSPSLHFMAAMRMRNSLPTSLWPDMSACILHSTSVSTPGSRSSPSGMHVPCFARLPFLGFFDLAAAILRRSRSIGGVGEVPGSKPPDWPHADVGVGAGKPVCVVGSYLPLLWGWTAGVCSRGTTFWPRHIV